MRHEKHLAASPPNVLQRQVLRERWRFCSSDAIEDVSKVFRLADFIAERLENLSRHSQTVVCVHVVISGWGRVEDELAKGSGSSVNLGILLADSQIVQMFFSIS